MPVNNSPSVWLELVGGTQTTATITTTPGDVSLTSCTITMATSYLSKLRVQSAWLELRTRVANTFVGSNGFGNCTLQMSPDAGSNWYTGIALLNFGSIPAVAANGNVNVSLVGTQELATYVQTAITTGTDITFKITGAVSTQNNYILDDIIVVLHLICV